MADEEQHHHRRLRTQEAAAPAVILIEGDKKGGEGGDEQSSLSSYEKADDSANVVVVSTQYIHTYTQNDDLYPPRPFLTHTHTCTLSTPTQVTYNNTIKATTFTQNSWEDEEGRRIVHVKYHLENIDIEGKPLCKIGFR